MSTGNIKSKNSYTTQLKVIENFQNSNMKTNIPLPNFHPSKNYTLDQIPSIRLTIVEKQPPLIPQHKLQLKTHIKTRRKIEPPLKYHPPDPKTNHLNEILTKPHKAP